MAADEDEAENEAVDEAGQVDEEAAVDEPRAESDEVAGEAEADEDQQGEEVGEGDPSSNGEVVEEDPRDLAWYVLKVSSNRESTIRANLLRKLKMEDLEYHVAQVLVPTEKVSEIRNNKKRIVEKKLFPGYIMIEAELTEDVRAAIREIPGVGDFVGAGGKPVPMTAADVDRMLGRQEETTKPDATPELQVPYELGDRVKVKEGAFENFEGNVEEINQEKGMVRVVIQIFGRPTPVDVTYLQLEKVE